MHTIRNLYHSRTSDGLKSVILVGVENITGVMQGNPTPALPKGEGGFSPFNINEELEVPYFTNDEILELLGMHETATGQLFPAKVKERICYMTAGQPGLVNGFAYNLIKQNPDAKQFEYEDYLAIEKNYIALKINKNISNIVEKAKRHREFVEKLLFKDTPIPFMLSGVVSDILCTKTLVAETVV